MRGQDGCANQKSYKQSDGRCWQQSPHASRVELQQTDTRGLLNLRNKKSRDEVAGKSKKNVHPYKSTRKTKNAAVEKNHCKNSNASKSLNICPEVLGAARWYWCVHKHPLSGKNNSVRRQIPSLACQLYVMDEADRLAELSNTR